MNCATASSSSRSSTGRSRSRMTPPAGPVYLSLPREALAAPMADFDYSPSPRLRAPAAPGAGAPGDRRGGRDPGARRAAADHRRPRRRHRARLRGARPLRPALRDPGGRVLAVAPVARDRPPDACRLRRHALAFGVRCGPGARRDGAVAAAAPSAAGELPGDPGRPRSLVLGPADAQLPGHGRDHRRDRRCDHGARRRARGRASRCLARRRAGGGSRRAIASAGRRSRPRRRPAAASR